MKKYLYSLFTVACLSSSVATAQNFSVDDDFGVDISVGAEKELLPDFEISVEGNLRTQDNTQRVERYLLGAELSYKFLIA